MQKFNWTCKYCNTPTTITDPNFATDAVNISTDESMLERLVLVYNAVACPNTDCRKLTLEIHLYESNSSYTNDDWHKYMPVKGKKINSWPLLPRSQAKPLPEYIPKQIRSDYYESCLICKDSPKASAALARRCLQGIIRDYWELPQNSRGNLGAEINFIKDKLDPDTWEAIDTIRSVGDIGAHMEKDVNVIIDVEPEEAELLIELIETLLEDWYVARFKRQERNAKTKELGKKKLDERRAAKKSKPQDASAAAPAEAASSEEMN
jgi:hypothetical protein